MKITLFNWARLTPESEKFLINFERNGRVVGKTFVTTHYGRDIDKEEIGRALQKAAREADRDLAFMEHGKDYRAHCEITSNYWGPLSGDELEKLLQC